MHFAMLRLDLAAGFRSGGFSRVYSALYRNRKVAVKLLFSIELDRDSILMFYKEAQILQDLQHENIVECVGITIMPPAIGVVMEYCQLGSLFDYLYVHHANQSDRSSKFGTESSVQEPDGVRLTLFRTTDTESVHMADSFSASDRGSLIHSTSRLRPSIYNYDNINKVRKANECSASALVLDKVTFKMMLDSAKGLAYMHSMGFMHCDIKSLNFLVADVGIVLIFIIYLIYYDDEGFDNKAKRLGRSSSNKWNAKKK